MRKISSSSGPADNFETSWEDRDSTETSARKKFYRGLIDKANSVPICKIFKHYGLKLNEQEKKIICPFPSHRGGRESSASFYFYPQTNSFWCFGCKIGIKCCDFISEMDSISRSKAATKILNLFGSDADDDASYLDKDSFKEKVELLMNFSELVRNFRESNFDEKSFSFIENICSVFDDISSKHNLSNLALASVLSQLKDKINNYELSSL